MDFKALVADNEISLCCTCCVAGALGAVADGMLEDDGACCGRLLAADGRRIGTVLLTCCCVVLACLSLTDPEADENADSVVLRSCWTRRGCSLVFCRSGDGVRYAALSCPRAFLVLLLDCAELSIQPLSSISCSS